MQGMELFYLKSPKSQERIPQNLIFLLLFASLQVQIDARRNFGFNVRCENLYKLPNHVDAFQGQAECHGDDALRPKEC